jgi:hypothetical protein
MTQGESNSYFGTGENGEVRSLYDDYMTGSGMYDSGGSAEGYSDTGGTNSCIWAYDGVCDETRYCAAGTDTYDCG